MAITGADIVNGAEKYSGVKYFEGNPQDRAHGFDCSGLVQRVMADLGMSISRTTSSQLADAIAHNQVIGTNLANAVQGDILHYTGHEEIWIGAGKVFSESIPGETAGVRDRTPWPIIGIVRYATGGPGPQVGQIGQTVPGQPTTETPTGVGGDPGKVSGQLVDIIPGASNVVDAVKEIWNIISGIGTFLTDVTSASFWARVGLAFLGVILMALGAYGMMHKANVIQVTGSMIKQGADIASSS